MLAFDMPTINVGPTGIINFGPTLNQCNLFTMPYVDSTLPRHVDPTEPDEQVNIGPTSVANVWHREQITKKE